MRVSPANVACATRISLLPQSSLWRQRGGASTRTEEKKENPVESAADEMKEQGDSAKDVQKKKAIAIKVKACVGTLLLKAKAVAVTTKDKTVKTWKNSEEARHALASTAKAAAITTKDKAIALWKSGKKGKAIIIGVFAIFALSCMLPLCTNGKGDGVIKQFDAAKNTCGRVARHGVQLWAGGPCWATTNIGADEPWEYGYYFWWGDTVGYKHENDIWVASDGLSSASGFSFGMTNTTTDDKSISKLKSDGWITEDGVLAPAHDAAQVQWGGGWRMPTRQELTDLCERCDWNWTTKNGVNGYDIYGRGDYASAGIFLPCAGQANIDHPRYVGAEGDYWSSVPSSNATSSSWGFYFSGPRDYNLGAHNTGTLDRIYGLPIRPVNETFEKDSINTSAPPPKAIADSSGRNVGDQNAPKSSSSRAGAAKGRVDNLDKYTFFEDGCLFRLEGCNVIYAENSSGGVNYLITTEVNLRPQIQFSDGGGAYYDSEIILFSFPTAESRKLWSSAMRSAFEKLLEWINTAKNNKVGHVEKELPESTFKNNCSYASVDWLDRGARQKENYFKAWRKYMGAAEFSKSARRVEFKCVVDSGDNLKFSAKLLAGCSGEFPFELYSCYGKTLDEIHSSVNELLRQIDPDSLAKVWVSQVERNSMFKDVAVGDNSSCDRLSVSKKDEEDARKNADSYRIVHSDLCNSTFVDHCRESSHPGGRDVFLVKDTDGDLNYVLRLGEDGVARRRTYFGRWHTDSDFAFDYHLIVFPTEKLRELWYETVKNSCGRMLEWVHFASRNHVPIVAKPIYNADKDASNKLMAYHNLITKGQGQDDLLKKSLRMHVNSSECERNGFPVSLICTIRNKDSESKRFAVNIELKCGDRYRGNIFETSGDYDCIQKECVEFLHKVDPDGLMEAWKEKCGRDDLFR